jgi:hypothetical protein
LYVNEGRVRVLRRFEEMTMKRVAMMCAVAGMMASGVVVVQAQMGAPPAGPASEVRGSYFHLRPNVLKAADKMPAEDYGYMPAAEMRTFARVVNHVTEAQLHSCGVVVGGGAGDAVKVPADTAGKAEILAALKASFEVCDKAYSTGITDENAAEMLKVGQGTRSRLGILWGNVSHDNEQYATLALYMRLKGLVPPTSEK